MKVSALKPLLDTFSSPRCQFEKQSTQHFAGTGIHLCSAFTFTSSLEILTTSINPLLGVFHAYIIITRNVGHWGGELTLELRLRFFQWAQQGITRPLEHTVHMLILLHMKNRIET